MSEGHPTLSAETEAVDIGRLRQGDVIRWETPERPWRWLGLVVTADCDIAHGKHAGTLSYVPILSLEDYLTEITVPVRIDSYLRETLRPNLFKRLRALKDKYRSDFTGQLSDEALEELLQREPAEVLDTLAVPSEQRALPVREITAYRAAILRASSRSTLREQVQVLAELRVASDLTKQPDPKKIIDSLHSSFVSLPGDAFFIGTINPDYRDGAVAYLRFVRETNADEIALAPKDLRRPNVKGRRVSRLTSPFVYRLTQQLGQVFSDIGLPTDYESRRTALVDRLRASLAAGEKTNL